MLLIDLTVPLDWNLPLSPARTPFSVKPIKRVVLGKS